MTIIYYRDNDGIITNQHSLKKDYPLEDLDANLERFNSESGRAQGRTAYRADFDDNDIEAYLVNYSKLERQKMRDAVSEAKDAIDEARNSLEFLEV